MIDYRKASAECREAYFKYLETSKGFALFIFGGQSAASFVAGWNAAMASMGFEHDEKICSIEATQFDNAECIHSDEPAKEPEPAWEPKVGDWVRVTRPENWKQWKDPLWREEMHIYDGKVFEVVKWSQSSTGQRASLQGTDWFFHRDWLSPAEPPAIDKPPEPEYREPVLPADYMMACEFSNDGNSWASVRLGGWSIRSGWISSGGVCWEYARIKINP